MAKVFIEETTLTAIGDAIREKTGSTDLIAPGSMPNEIKGIVSGGGSGEGDIPEEALVITGNCQYRFANNGWNWFIEKCGNKITTQDIIDTSSMFRGLSMSEIPFEINCKTPGTYDSPYQTYMFYETRNLTTLPKINNMTPYNMNYFMSYAISIESLPDDYGADWNWDKVDETTGSYGPNFSNMFSNCYRLRNIPYAFLSHGNTYGTTTGSLYAYGFQNCHSLEKLENTFVPYNATLSSNMFSKSFDSCYRLKALTFATQEDGTSYVVKWKNQTIDLTTVGFSKTDSAMMSYTDFTTDTKIDSVSKWRDYVGYPDQGLPGKGDGWASDRNWSVFGKSATVNLINSLPDTSAYLASSGGTNTVKLYSMAAYNVTYECIGDYLTEEEIAVATAKGWTISLT